MGQDADIESARAAFADGDWVRAHEGFLRAQQHAPLGAADLNALAEAAWWMGRAEESLAGTEQAYELFLEEGDQRAAARCALDAAYAYLLAGDEAVGSGWVARARRLIESEPDCAERGYLVHFVAEAELAGDDLESAATAARDVSEIGRRYDDADLIAMGTVCEGRALIKLGRVREGLELLDEGMLAATSGTLRPTWAGNVYCHLMSACHELADIDRAREWTDLTARWCREVSPAVLFRGICRVHRAQVLQVSGDWATAEREVESVKSLGSLHKGIAAEAFYQAGELCRLRGDAAGAEAAYRRAHAMGRDPQPGLARLRAWQGRCEAAATSLNTALLAEPKPLARAPLLAAQVWVAQRAGDADTARSAAEELSTIARAYASSGLEASALHARGTASLAEGKHADAIAELRAAARDWANLGAPYDAALARVLLAEALRAVGDEDAADLEVRAAREAFEALGAAAEAAGLAGPRGDGELSAREGQVLGLVAAGRTNREIAGVLSISERTVARHLSNIFAKIGVASRTAAAAYAITRGMAGPGSGVAGAEVGVD